MEVLHDRDGVAERVRPGGAVALRVPAPPLQAEALPARPLRLQADDGGGDVGPAEGANVAHLPEAQPPPARRP